MKLQSEAFGDEVQEIMDIVDREEPILIELVMQSSPSPTWSTGVQEKRSQHFNFEIDKLKTEKSKTPKKGVAFEFNEAEIS